MYTSRVVWEERQVGQRVLTTLPQSRERKRGRLTPVGARFRKRGSQRRGTTDADFSLGDSTKRTGMAGEKSQGKRPSHPHPERDVKKTRTLLGDRELWGGLKRGGFGGSLAGRRETGAPQERDLRRGGGQRGV